MAERFDLDAIEADDALLDLLAAGGETAWAAAEHDPALMVLAELRLAVEVADELPVESIDDPESFLARCAALNPVTDPFARKMAARGFALGVAAVAALSVSGVAAAVNGDPLSPYEKVIEKVVDGLRPQTSVPKEKLDGMSIFDKKKIVRVGKDYEQKQADRKAAKDAEEKTDATVVPPADRLMVFPPLARVIPPQAEKPTTTKDPVVPPAVDPTKPSDPVDEPTDPPTDPPTEPTTPPPTEPSSDPTPTPTPTETPTDEPTVPAGTGEGDNGATGEEPSKNPVDDPATAPPAIPTIVPGESTGATDNGQTGDTKPSDTEVSTPADQTGDQPASDQTEAATLSEVLPTPTGESTELPTRLEQYFGDSLSPDAKHSSGKVALGYAKGKYPGGKHSNGQYVEGKHAAIARAHGSMAELPLLQILSVLNSPMTER